MRSALALNSWVSIAECSLWSRYFATPDFHYWPLWRAIHNGHNWLFADTVSGAKASAHLYSLVQTARANELEPYAYLRRLFAELPAAQTVEQIEALLPFNVAHAGSAP